jgi:hypothetical protein
MATFVGSVTGFTTTSGTKTANLVSVQFGALIVVFAANTGQTATPTVTDANSDGLGAYTEITSALKNTSADKMFVFTRNALVGVVENTLVTMTPGTTTGGGLEAIQISGMTRVGAAAIRQSAREENQAAAGTPTPVFSVAALTENLCLGAVFNASNPAAMTPRGSPVWTEQTDVGYATPTTGLEVMSINSGETATSIAWGGTSATAFCSIVVELDTSVVFIPRRPSTNFQDPGML